jgi:hypothetical protein
MEPASIKTLRRIFVLFAALWISGSSANVFFDEWPRGAHLFSEAEMKACEELWTKHLAFKVESWHTRIREAAPGGRRAGWATPAMVEAFNKELERSSGLSGLEYGRQSSSAIAAFDLSTTRKRLKEIGEDLAVLQSGSDDRIGQRFHYQLAPREIDERLTESLTLQCTFNLRLAQLTNKTAAKPGAKTGSVLMASKQDPLPKVGGGGPNEPPPAPRPGNGSPGLGVGTIGAPLPKLSPAQVTACSEEIKRTQIDSQRWPGDVNDVAARLGRFQKDMFEGRCVGHPDAQAYIAGANKMLGYRAVVPAASAGLAVAQSSADNGNTTVGRAIQNNIGSNQPQRLANDPPPMGHIEMGGGPFKGTGIGPFTNPSGDRLAQENLDREHAYQENLKRYEEEQRKIREERAEAQRQLEAREKQELQAQLEAKAAERSNRETKVRSAIFGPGGIVHYMDSASCQYVVTNTTDYWVTVVWDYTVTITFPGEAPRSHQSQNVFEVAPRQTTTSPIFAVWGGPTCTGEDKATWGVPGGAITLKDNANNYPGV